MVESKLEMREALIAKIEGAAQQLRDVLRKEGIVDVVDCILEGIGLLKHQGNREK